MIATPIYTSSLAEGLLYQQYSPNIHSFVCSNISNEVIDVIYDKLIALDQQAAAEKQHIGYLFVLDNVQYSPYMLRKINQSIAQMSDEQSESTAVVTDAFTVSILKRLLMPFVDDKVAQSTQFFTTEPEALDWLKQRAKQFDNR